MTGLEQIIKQIEDDAAASAASIRRLLMISLN